jgi:ElaB/YqjD/DUF883 family membrane-anchored ribosome-binding protein
MGKLVFELGNRPFVRIGAAGDDLELRGSDRSNVRIDGDIPEGGSSEGEGLIVPRLEGSATVRLPKLSRVQLGDVSASLLAKYVEGGLLIQEGVGNDAVIRYSGPVSIEGRVGSSLMLKYISGACEANIIEGDLIAKYTGDIHLDTIGTSLQAAYVEGDIRVNDVKGDLMLRNVEGIVDITHVGGSAQVKNVPRGASLADVAGDLVLKTAFMGEVTSHYRCVGSARIRVERGSHVRFILPASTDVYVDESFTSYYEGDRLMVVLGDGLADVHLEAGGEVSISTRGTYSTEHEADYPLDSELSEELSNISMQMDEQMSRIESLLGGIGDHVRRRVERKLEVARRRVEEAQRRVEEAVESAVVNVPQTKTITINTDMQRPADEPVSEQERVMILQMLEQGTINVEEAEKLLAALEE